MYANIIPTARVSVNWLTEVIRRGRQKWRQNGRERGHQRVATFWSV